MDVIGDEEGPNGPTKTTWQFTPPIYAYGGNWNLAGPGGPGSAIEVYVNQTLVGIIPNTYSGQFWGFVSTELFSSVHLQEGAAPSGWRETYEMDNMVYAFASELELTKIDDVNDGDCVVPGQEINYTITYEFTGAGDTNVLLIDHLPAAVDYNSSSPEGDYNAVDGNIIWDIGTVPTDGNGTFTLNCLVNYDAEPCSIMTNSCEIAGDSTNEAAEVNTPVCFWNQIIYVDHNATGLNNGLSWEDAYLDLQDALERAAVEVNSEIWVARGTYKPSIPSGSPTFQFIDSVPVFGHFAGGETSRGQRDLNDSNNETILSGIGTPAPFVVSASGHRLDNILDGFTVFGAGASGNRVKIENAYLKVSNCIIAGASVAGYGIYDTNSAFIVTDCVVRNNSYGLYSNFSNNGNLSESRISNSVIYNNNTGVHLHATSSPVLIENSFFNNNGDGIIVAFSSMPPVVKGCRIFANSGRGIYVSHSPIGVIDNLIYRNTQRGIYLYYPTSPTTIRNNTIACNNQYGIYRYGGTTPVINSSIIWGNPSGDLSGCSGNYLHLTSNGDPCFVEADINDFHIRPFSRCVNAGDPSFNDLSEVDIDGQCRVMIGQTTPRVDIGADEIEWPKADFDRDEVINFTDYAILASAWQTIDPNKTLDNDEDVDIDDLAQFCDYWLWAPSWDE